MIRAQELEQEVRRCTSAIRDVFAVDGDLDEADVDKLHSLLTECVETVNARLRRCDSLLRKGLRQEALQECDSPPNLLDLVNEIDMPEWEAWAEYVRQFGFPPQTPLALEVAAELNGAYTQSHKMEGLLKKHRLLALARSSLSSRLALLRTIAERDAENQVWLKDVETFEVARIRQLDVEANQALAQKNLRALTLINAELEGVAWRIRPPQNLVERVKTAHRRLVVEDAKRQLGKLARQIDAAYSEASESSLEELRKRWIRLAETADLQESDDLAAQVAPGFEWLDAIHQERDREAAFARAIGELDLAIDDERATQAELTRLLVAAESFDQPVPKTLLHRHDRRVEAIQLAGKRRAMFLLLTSVAALTLIAAGVAFATFRQIRYQEIDALEQALRTDLDSGEFRRGIERFEEAQKERPHIASDDGVKSIYGSLRTKLDEEAERRRSFDAHLAAAVEAAEKGGWDDVATARTEIAAAKDIALDSNRTRLAQAERSVQRVEDDLRAKADGAFAEALTPMREAIARLRSLTSEEIETEIERIRALRKMPHVSSLAMTSAQLDLSLRSLEVRREEIGLEIATAEAFEQVAAAIETPAAYRTALERYRNVDTASERAADFKRTIESDLPVLAKISEWNEAAGAWNLLDLTEVEPDTAAAALDDLKEFATFPGGAAALATAEYFESMRERPDSLKSMRSELDEEPMRLKGMKRLDGSYIYCESLRAATPNEAGIFFDVFISLEPSLEKKKTYVRRDEVVGGDLELSDSPQLRLAKDILSTALTGKRTFELESCHALHKLLADENVDPVLKLQKLDRLTDDAMAGSSILQARLKPFREAVNGVKEVVETEYDTVSVLSAVNWLVDDGTQPELNAIQERIASGLDKAFRPSGRGTDWSDISPAMIYTLHIIEHYESTIANPAPLPTFRWVASLIKDGEGRWVCRTRERSELPPGPLFLYDAAATDDPFSPVDPTNVTLPDPLDLYEGRPVFLRQG